MSEAFEAFIYGSRLADIVLVVLAVEAVWLMFAKGWRLVTVVGLIGPAIFLVLALKAALIGAGWEWIAVLLALSLPLHLLDLRARLSAKSEP